MLNRGRDHPVLPVYMRALTTLLFAAAAAAVIAPAHAASATGPATIVRLTAAASCAEPAALTDAGARQIDAKLRLWRLEADTAGSLLPALERREERSGGVGLETPEP